MLSGTQFIFSAMGNKLELNLDSEYKCRVCGGPMSEELNKCSFSSNWTGESSLKRIDHEYVCDACKWFMEKNNRGACWNKSFGYIATENEILYCKTVVDFWELLSRKEICFPALFMIKGHNTTLLRKHTQWKSINALTMSKKSIKIIFSGIQVHYGKGNVSELDGFAEFELDAFIDTVYRLIGQIKKYLLKWSKRRYRNYFTTLKKVYKMQMTPTLLIACFFAAEIVKSEEKNSESI